MASESTGRVARRHRPTSLCDAVGDCRILGTKKPPRLLHRGGGGGLCGEGYEALKITSKFILVPGAISVNP
jgi:hypothetical protein